MTRHSYKARAKKAWETRRANAAKNKPINEVEALGDTDWIAPKAATVCSELETAIDKLIARVKAQTMRIEGLL